jgi:CheY-like chemotaxis protein
VDLNKMILVVDDTRDIRDAIEGILENEGYSTVSAADGRAALSELHKGLRPDLILLDLMMPGMGGLEFREEQLADPALAEIPVLLMTAMRTLDAKSLNLTHLLLKPFGPAQLLAAIEAAQKEGARIPRGGSVPAPLLG